MKSRIILFADEGKVLTNGETYGTQVYLGEGDKPENWREITEEEFKEVTENEN